MKKIRKWYHRIMLCFFDIACSFVDWGTSHHWQEYCRMIDEIHAEEFKRWEKS